MHIFDSQTIQNRRQRLKTVLDNFLGNNSLVLIASGDAIPKPGGLDQTYPFLPLPEYYWLTGLRRPWGVVAYSKSEGFVDFVQPVSDAERLWEGVEGNVEGLNVADLNSWISKKKFQDIFLFGSHKISADSSLAAKSRHLELQELINSVRRVKDEAEIALVKRCAQAALKGYEALEKFIRPGVTERDIQIEYESTVLRAGADKFPYDTIVGAGSNAAVLHFYPSKRVVKENDLVLIDAGADIEDYCVDITRVFSASGKFTSQQQAIYDIVKKAQAKSVSMCTPGTSWPDVHAASARIIAEGLKDLNILKCDAETALETQAVSVFFPHGVGHLVGLRVRDVGGIVTKPAQNYFGVNLRVDLTLKENYLITVEPGLYFVKNLLDNTENRSKYAELINWSEVEKWKDIGGVRIEDDILVAETPQNLTESVKK